MAQSFPGKTIWMTEYNAGLGGSHINGSVHALFQVTPAWSSMRLPLLVLQADNGPLVSPGLASD